MKTRQPPAAEAPTKSATGSTGFDEMTGGGLSRARTSLLVGGPGSGKTIFGPQFLAHGIDVAKEPGIFVAFEETSERILSNARGFGWDLDRHVPAEIFFLDAQPTPDLVRSGDFDLMA